MPVFNAAPFIETALLSALVQMEPRDEIVIQDAGSTDGTIDIVSNLQDSRIKLVSEPDSGQSDALQRCLSRATGDIVGWLNADDIIAENALRKIREVWESVDDLDVAIAGWSIFDNSARAIREYYPETLSLARLLKRGQYIFSGSTFFSTTFLKKIGGFDSRYHYCMDFELSCRAASHFPTTTSVHLLAGGLRWHEESKSGQSGWPFVRESIQIRRKWAPSLGIKGWVCAGLGVFIHVVAVFTTPIRHSRLYSAIRFFAIKR